MQGGCTCENCCNLRVGTGNVEFAALFAPKPQGMTTADDWTKEMSTKGFPQLKELYALVGAPLAAVLARPWADVVLSGAVTSAQLDSNLASAGRSVAPTDAAAFAALAEEPSAYWRARSHRSRT